MNKLIILLALALPAFTWHGTSEDEVRRPVHLNQRLEEMMGFAQAYQVGSTVYVSGVSGKGDAVGAQLRSAYKRVHEILQEVGAEPRHIVKETIYTTNMSSLAGANEVRKTFYADHLPASTFVGIERLLRQADQVGIEVVIELP